LIIFQPSSSHSHSRCYYEYAQGSGFSIPRVRRFESISNLARFRPLHDTLHLHAPWPPFTTRITKCHCNRSARMHLALLQVGSYPNTCEFIAIPAPPTRSTYRAERVPGLHLVSLTKLHRFPAGRHQYAMVLFKPGMHNNASSP